MQKISTKGRLNNNIFGDHYSDWDYDDMTVIASPLFGTFCSNPISFSSSEAVIRLEIKPFSISQTGISNDKMVSFYDGDDIYF
jgi:hypothetical protein